MSDRLTSVVIPTFNGAGTLADALDSLAAQAKPAHEVIVVDDGSSDGSAGVAASHALSPMVIRLAGNHGVAFARNVGLAAASGRYVGFLDQDDLWLPDRLQVLEGVLEAHPEIRVVYTDAVRFALESDREELEAMGHDFLPWVQEWCAEVDVDALARQFPSPSEPAFRVTPRRRLIAGPVSVTTSYLIERELLQGVGGTAGWLRSADDWVMLLTLSAHADVYEVDHPSMLYRVHPHNTSVSTDWPMPLLLANLAVRYGRQVVPAGSERDVAHVGGLGDSDFLSHLLTQLAAQRRPLAVRDAWAVWHLLSPRGADRARSARLLLRAQLRAREPSAIRSWRKRP